MKLLTKQTLKIYWQHMSHYPWVMFFMISGQIVANILAVIQPVIFKNFVDMVASPDPDTAQALLHLLYLWIGIHVTMHLVFRFISYLNDFFQPRVMSDILNTCFRKLHEHSYRFFSSNFTGSIVRWVGRFERSFEQLADQVYWHIGEVVLQVIFILIILWQRHWLISVIIFVWVLLYTGLNFIVSRPVLARGLTHSKADSAVTGHLADTVTNSINLKLFGSSSKEQNSFQELTEHLYKAKKRTWFLREHINFVQGFLMIGLQFLVLYFAIRFWQRGILTVGDFVLIQVYIFSIFDHIWDLGRFIQHIYIALAEAEEMTAVLETDPEVQDQPKAKKLKVTKGQIEFKDVSFDYPGGVRVFRRFNLSVKPGEKLALVGPSGGGKSTFVKVLLKFYDINSGTIEIDGQNISQVTQNSLRESIAMVPQDPILFHRPLLENIRYAKPRASKAEVIKAAKLAHAHEFISKLKDGYNTYVGERGIKLSGGERQRVAIARAILKNSPVLILDEATSSLDSESELYIQDALSNLMRNRTTIVIAHRLSTIMKTDRIVVIQDGKIIEQGKHKELLKVQKGAYQKLWDIQAGGFAQG